MTKNLIKEYNTPFSKELVDKSLFVIDNNCLMFPLKDYILGEQILEAFKKIQDNVYIPYITQIEYLNNQSNVIHTRTKNINDRNKEIGKTLENTVIIDDTIIRDKVKDIFSLSKAANNDDNKSIKERVDDIREKFLSSVDKNLEDEDFQDSFNRLLENIFQSLEISKEELKKLKIDKSEDDKKLVHLKRGILEFLDKVSLGEHYTTEQINNYSRLIKERYDSKISPGYEDIAKDKNAENSIILGEKFVRRSYSDAIFWLDSLEYTKNVTKEYLILISNEKKPDWVKNEDANLVNSDMYSECFEKTGKILKKIDIWTLVSILGIEPESSTKIRESKETFDGKNYDFYLYGEHHSAINQREMMEIVFDKVLSREDGEQFIDILRPCLRSLDNPEYSEDNLSTSFATNKKIMDKMGKRYLLGTSHNLQDKLRHIRKLLETRVKGSSGQLKFLDDELQLEWKKIVEKSRYRKL